MGGVQKHQDDGFGVRWQFEASAGNDFICARAIDDSVLATSVVSLDEPSESASNGGGICSHSGLTEYPR